MEWITSLKALGTGYVVPFLIVLTVVVFVHEFGHYLVARLCGVRVTAFSLGFGKAWIKRRDKHGTSWQIGWLPLGGYVKMFGDSDPASSGPSPEAAETLTPEERKVAFFAQPVVRRAAIVVAGPLVNYLFAFVVLAGLFWSHGQPFAPPVIATVQEGSAAEQSGLLPGDVVVALDGTTARSFEDIRRTAALNVGTPLVLEILREGAPRTITVTPKVVIMKDVFGGEHTTGRLGVASGNVVYRSLSGGQSLVEAAHECWTLTTGTLRGVGQMIIGMRGTDELGGPLRIAEMSGKVAQEGFAALAWFTALLSLNLGLINLFPIPLLDGGHLFFYLIEAVRRRPLGARAQEIGANIGLALVVSLMVLATWNDLVHLRIVAYVRGLFS